MILSTLIADNLAALAFSSTSSLKSADSLRQLQLLVTPSSHDLRCDEANMPLLASSRHSVILSVAWSSSRELPEVSTFLPPPGNGKAIQQYLHQRLRSSESCLIPGRPGMIDELPCLSDRLARALVCRPRRFSSTLKLTPTSRHVENSRPLIQAIEVVQRSRPWIRPPQQHADLRQQYCHLLRSPAACSSWFHANKYRPHDQCSEASYQTPPS